MPVKLPCGHVSGWGCVGGLDMRKDTTTTPGGPIDATSRISASTFSSQDGV